MKLTEKQKALKEHKKLVRFVIKRIKQINSYDLERIAKSLGYRS